MEGLFEKIMLNMLNNDLIRNDLIVNKLKNELNCKTILKRMIYIINQNAEKIITLLNIPCLLFFKRYR